MNIGEYLITSEHKQSSGDALGMELEVEFRRAFPFKNPGTTWLSKEEGSLRNFGVEFYSAHPVAPEFRRKELDDLISYVKSNGAMDECPRASFHVHMNVLDLTPIQVYTYATVYWTLENLLFKYCGEKQRNGNLFCLRLTDAPGILDILSSDIQYAGAPFKDIGTDNIRYAGLNLNAVRKFGTMEFRGMRCKLDSEYLDLWCESILSMKKNSLKYKSPLEVMEKYWSLNTSSPTEYLREFLPEKMVSFISSFPDWRKYLLNNNTDLTYFVLYNDWDSWKKKSDTYIENYKKKPRSTSIRTPTPTIDIFNNVLTGTALRNAATIQEPNWNLTEQPDFEEDFDEGN